MEDIHSTKLRCYADSKLKIAAILPHVLYSETGMPAARLMRLQSTSDGIMVHVRWKGLKPSAYTLEPVLQVFEDVSDMLKNLPKRNTIDKDLIEETEKFLHL